MNQDYETGATAPLNPQIQNAAYGSTEDLARNAAGAAPPPQFVFESTEHTVVIHTNETI